jgi:DNA-binding NarL/FixJ family response regulator
MSDSLETRILLVAGHALVRAGLRAVLEATPGLVVVGESPRAQEALGSIERTRPEAILIADTPSDQDEIDAVTELQGALSDGCVLCLATNAVNEIVGVPCVPPTADTDALCAILGTALGGRCAGCHLRKHCPASTMEIALSRRERQVAICVADGMSSKQIAHALGIALRTVNTYRESLARKLGASSPAVVTRYVLQHNLSSGGVG